MHKFRKANVATNSDEKEKQLRVLKTEITETRMRKKTMTTTTTSTLEAEEFAILTGNMGFGIIINAIITFNGISKWSLNAFKN